MATETSVREQPLAELIKAAFAEAAAARTANATKREEVRATLAELDKEAAGFEETMRLLTGLMNSWQEFDPGKNRAAFFFLTKKDECAVINGLYPADAVCTKEEWREYRNTAHRGLSSRKLAPYYPRIDVADAARDECPHCRKNGFLVQRYEQTEDSAEGDTWMKQKIIVCLELDCGEVTNKKPEYSSSRF